MTTETKDLDSYVQMYYAFAIQLYLGEYCAVILTGGYFVL